MRTTILIDDELMAEAMKVSGARTKREAVEMGLKVLVRLVLEQQGEVRRLRGKVNWKGDLEAMRADE